MQPTGNFNRFIETPKHQPRHLFAQPAPDSHEEQESQQELFAEYYTPQRENYDHPDSENLSVDPFKSCPILKNKRRDSLDLEERSESSPEAEDIQEPKGLIEKPEIREQPMTPHVQKRKEDEDDPIINATTRKKPPRVFGTPASQSKSTERSLRRLACQAYKFACTQKRTTYKEVANKLISQLTEDSQSNSQMNIKRRVYDALNVLIALGLLKRVSTNKILSRKSEFDFPGGRVLPERGGDNRREQLLLQELERLKSESNKRRVSLEEKRKVHKVVSARVNRLRELQRRNMTEMQDETQHIQLPFVVMSSQEGGRVRWGERRERMTYECGEGRPKLLGDTDVVSAHLELEGRWVSMAVSKPATS